MTGDYKNGLVTVGEIDEVIFKFKSEKVAKAYPSYESWQQDGNVMIDPDVLDVTFGALHDCGYLEEQEE